MKENRISRREALLLGGGVLLHALLPAPALSEAAEDDLPRVDFAASSDSSQKVLLLRDSTDPLSRILYPQIAQALDYAKIAYDEMDMGQTLVFGDLSGYSALVIATEAIWRFNEQEALKVVRYVTGGGGLAVLVRGWNRTMGMLFGAQDWQEPDDVLIDSGLHFVGDLCPGLKGLQIEKKHIYEFSALDVKLQGGIEVLAVSGDGQYPLLWRHKFGRGRVVYWNNDLLIAKALRGLAVQLVLDVHPVAVMTLVNAGLFHIDDYPAPASTRKIEPLASEYDMSPADFYYKVWFPDMMRLARKYGLRYLWIIPFNYNGRIAPPWDFNEWVHAKAEMNGQEVPICAYMSHQAAREGHELALHGYCHQSLRLDWWQGDTDNMVAALEAARQRWQEDSMGPLPFSYVAPNNLYDAAGLEALHQAFPSIKVVGGMSSGSFEEGGNREFGPEPWNDELYSIPRWTNGYFGEPFTRLVAASELNMLGVWTHFVHPDDILNTKTNYPTETDPRNPYDAPWRTNSSNPVAGMYDQLDSLLAWGQEHYPWLRWMTTRDSHAEFVNYFDTQAGYTVDEGGIKIEFSKHPTHLLIRLNEGQNLDLRRVTNAQIISIQVGEGYTQYVLKGMGKEVRLGLLASD